MGVGFKTGIFNLPDPFDDSQVALSGELAQTPPTPVKPAPLAEAGGTDFSIDIPANSQLPHEKFINMQDLTKAILTGAGAMLTGGLSLAAGAGIAGLSFAGEKSRDEQVDESLAVGTRAKAAETEIELQGKFKMAKLGIDDAKLSMGSSTAMSLLINAADAGRDAYKTVQDSFPNTPEYRPFKVYPFEAAAKAVMGTAGTRNTLQLMKLLLGNNMPGAEVFMEGFKRDFPGLSDIDYARIARSAQSIPEDVHRIFIEQGASPQSVHQFMQLNAVRRMTDPIGADSEFDAVRKAQFPKGIDDFLTRLTLATSVGLDTGTLVEQRDGIATPAEVSAWASDADKQAWVSARANALDNMTAAQTIVRKNQFFREGYKLKLDLAGGYDTVAMQEMITGFDLTEEKIRADPNILQQVKERIIQIGGAIGLTSKFIEDTIKEKGGDAALLNDLLDQVWIVENAHASVVKPKAR